jgi:hypothetical protein
MNGTSVPKQTNYIHGEKVLETPIVAQLLKNFPTFYRIRRFITMFTRAP